MYVDLDDPRNELTSSMVVGGIISTMKELHAKSKAAAGAEMNEQMKLLYSGKPAAHMSQRKYDRLCERAYSCIAHSHKLAYRITRDPETYAPILHVRAL